MVKKLSNYELIFEMLYDGKAGVMDKEPISMNDIVNELGSRSKKNFGLNKEAWINWFFSEDEVSTEDKKNLSMVLKIINIEERALYKLDEQNND